MKGKVFAILVLLLVLAPAFSTLVSIPAFKVESYNGVNPATGGTYYNGTIAGVGASDRNFTAFFNVTNYVGNYFSDFGVQRSNSVGWSASGNTTGNCVYGIIESASVSNRQANPSASTQNTNSSNNVAQMVATGYISNRSSLNFTGPVYLEENFLIYTALVNSSCGAVAVGELNPNLDFLTLYIDDSDITTNVSVPSAPERWRSLDFDDTSSADTSALTSRIIATRNDGRDFDVVSDGGFSRAVKSNTATSLFYGAFLNSSGSNFVFSQINDTFSVFPVNLSAETFVATAGYNRVYSFPGVTTIAGTKYPFYGMFSEIQTANTFPTLKPIDCFFEFERLLDSTASVRAKIFCGAPNGLSAGTERAYLRDSTNATLSEIFSGSNTLSETTLTNGGTYNVLFGLPTLSNKTFSFTLPTTGLSKITLYQYINGTLFLNYDSDVSGSNLIFGDSSATFYFEGNNATTGSNIFSVGKTQKYSLMSVQSPAYKTHFGTSPGLAYLSVVFASPSGETFERGVFHSVVPDNSAIVSYTCPTSVTIQSGVAWTITCTDLSITASQSQFITAYSSSNSLAYIYGLLNNYKYRSLTTDAGSIERVLVQDLNGLIIPSELRTDSFDILKQTATTNTSKFYKFTFYDVSGATYTAFSTINYIIGNPTGAQSNGHHAVFLSFVRNSTGLYNLPYVSVNVSGGTCTTQLSDVVVNNATQTFAKCDVYVPNSLAGLSLVFNQSENITTLNNTFWGYYNDTSVSPLGINTSDYGSVYYYTWDATAGRDFVALDVGTCDEPEVTRQSNNSNEYCGVVSCPVTRTIDRVDSWRVNPNTFTCASPGSQKCFKEGAIAYKIVCGNICQVEPEICPTNSCNADYTGCENEATAQTQSQFDVFNSNPALKFFLADHLTFTFGIGLAVVFAFLVYKLTGSGQGAFVTMLSVVIGFAFLDGVGFVAGLVLLIALFVGIVALWFMFGGLTGLKGG